MADTPMDTLTEATEKAQAPSSETPEQRSERMRKLAQRPRKGRVTKPRIGTEVWRERLQRDIQAAGNDPQFVKAHRGLKAEIKAVGTDPSETLVRITAEQTAVCAYITGALFSAGLGGGVNKHKKRLHDLVEQRNEQTAALLSLRRRCGLDPESMEHPQSFSEAFKAAVLRDETEGGPTLASQLESARERARVHELEQHAREKAETERRIAEAVARATGAPWPPPELLTGPPTEPAQPTDACNPPAPTEPEAWRREYMGAVAAQSAPLELEPDVQDLGNVRSRAPSLDELRQHQQQSSPAQVIEPRQQILRNARIPGTNIWTDSDGFALPSPWDHR